MHVHPRVSHQCIDGEVVIINLDTGIYYSLLGSAAVLWDRIAAGWTREELFASVAAAYPESPEAGGEANAFVDTLIREGLVLPHDADAPRSGGALPLPDEYTSPRIDRFTDMQELLMLDPIHEVDAAGWPHKPAAS